MSGDVICMVCATPVERREATGQFPAGMRCACGSVEQLDLLAEAKERHPSRLGVRAGQP